MQFSVSSPPFFPSLSPIVISHFAYLRPYPCHYNKLEFPLHPCPCRDYESTVHSLVPFMLMRYVLYYIWSICGGLSACGGMIWLQRVAFVIYGINPKTEWYFAICLFMNHFLNRRISCGLH